MTPLVEAGPATPEQAKLLPPAPPEDNDPCDVASPPVAATWAGLTVVASVKDGVGVYTAHGELLGRLDSLDCVGSQSGLRSVALAQLLPDPDPEIVVATTLGSRRDYYTDVTVLKLHGGKLVKIFEYQPDGFDDAQKPLSSGHARLLPGGGIEVLPAGEKVPVRLAWDWSKFAYAAQTRELPRFADSFVPMFVTGVTATSTFPSRKDSYAAWRVLAPTITITDNEGGVEFDSAWCEGRPDEGVGEGIAVELAEPLAVDELAIGAGVWKSDKLFAANNLPTELTVTLSDGRRLSATVPAGMEPAEVYVGGAPIAGFKVTFAAVKKGRMNDSCLTFVRVMSEGRQAQALLGVDRTALAALPAGVTAITDAARACKADALARVVDFPVTLSWGAWGEAGPQEGKTASFATAKALVARKCPVDLPTRDELDVASHAPGELRVFTHASGPLAEYWHLVWRGNRWLLAGVDTL